VTKQRNKGWLLVLVVWAAQALAADPVPSVGGASSPSNSGIKTQGNKFTLDFDDELVTGKSVNPGVDFVFVRGQFNGKKMIRLRDNFLPEIENGKQEFSGKK
jgi:hypothetical protein